MYWKWNCIIFQSNIDGGKNLQSNTNETSSEKEKDKTKDGEMDMINVSSSCDKVVVCKYMSIFFI